MNLEEIVTLVMYFNLKGKLYDLYKSRRPAAIRGYSGVEYIGIFYLSMQASQLCFVETRILYGVPAGGICGPQEARADVREWPRTYTNILTIPRASTSTT